MYRTIIFALFSLAAGTAGAQYKCVGIDGAVTFQQAPCASAARETKLIIKANGGEAPASAPQLGNSADERQLARMVKERKMRETQQQIKLIEADIVNRNGRMTAELDELRHRKSFARNNLAGATYEQSLSGEMQAVAQKYKTMNDVDFERVKQLRAELSTLTAKP